MNEYDSVCVKYFFENQSQLFVENIADTLEEAEAFLEDCMAVICSNIKEVRAYFADIGVDISDMTDQDLEEAAEVFTLPDNRFLIVES